VAIALRYFENGVKPLASLNLNSVSIEAVRFQAGVF
jgi:hypothetical protein